ncbi:hypothetical protein AWM75_03805 [Aerococcus urinaehominis]|uniref:Uncharacterized protein n=1 Tax=Aerococcus urinaehominis TaxID=128944 RepID=A0A0X8FKV4_9LACT|nr:DUF975 family protein [Aerococcus urinaehominis]AMB99183.1 hypothetical protein AWM75_03805 [Aerococcus urinaehominis]SDM06646.1 Uncharacterized membrane protein [Aerococcus urinaehominis]
MRTHNKRPLSAVRREAKEILKGNGWTIVGIIFVLAIISGIFAGVTQTGVVWATDNSNLLVTFGLALVSILVAVVFFLINQYGYRWAYLNMVDSGLYQMEVLFSALKKRPVRSLLISLLLQIIRFILAIPYLIILFIAALLFTSGRLDLDPSQLQSYMQTSQVILQTNLWQVALMAVIALVWTVIALAYLYNYALVTYLAYDNQELGVAKIFSASHFLMKGNRLRLFSLQIVYGLLAVLALGFGFLLVSLAWLFLSPLLAVLTSLVIYLLFWAVSLRLSLLYETAFAVFYRDLVDTNLPELHSDYPGFPSPSPVSNDPNYHYHDENRPSFSADSVAVDAQLSRAADRMASDLGEDALVGGAAAVFTAATTKTDQLADEQISAADDIVVDLDSDLDFNQDQVVYSESYGLEADTIKLTAADQTDAAVDHLGLDIESGIDAPLAASSGDQRQTDQAEEFLNQPELNNSSAEPGQVDEQSVADDFSVIPNDDEKLEEVEAEVRSEAESVEKKPYEMGGYNLPGKTDFGHVKNEKDFLLSVEASENDRLLGPSDFMTDEEIEAAFSEESDQH